MRAFTGRHMAIALGVLALAMASIAGTAAARSTAAPEYAPVCSHALPHGLAGCDAIKLLHPSANWHGTHMRGADPAGVVSQGKGPGGSHPGKGRKEEPVKEEEPVTEKEPEPTLPAGYGPAELQSAYGLSTASAERGGTQTVAIVDAYNDPNAEADLGVYRSMMKLPALPACATVESTSCFEKVNQKGGTASYPSANSSWSEEISLDLDMVSAICPHCKILLVEANSNGFENLGEAENYAAAHANAVSNSYGGSEFAEETAYDTYYHHAGVAITVSSGDSGYGVEYPAASPYVTAVGGTSLEGSAGKWTQTVWSGSGAGCSAVEPNPGWQPQTECSRRTVADTAADANPNTGVAVYDSYGSASGWMVFGGTSVASPTIASVYALAGNTSQFDGNSAQGLYSAGLHRVLSGYDLNRHRCQSYLCSANYSLEGWSAPLGEVKLGAGWYNGPTGNGAPEALAGF